MTCLVTAEEMKKWIKGVQDRWMYEDVDRRWKRYDEDADGLVSWEEYKNNSYRYAHVRPEGDAAATKMAARGESRFREADRDGDGKVNREELAAFLHPEHFEHMKDLLVLEALEDLDTNGDGHLDLDEYLGDMLRYMGAEQAGGGPGPGEQHDPAEHPWVMKARQHFTEVVDKNKDGRMDKAEIREWILPNTDYAGDEARHLVHMSDADKDGRLTRSEILDKYNLFVGSVATEFGNALYHHTHDEF